MAAIARADSSPPANVAPQTLEPRRIAGIRDIAPDQPTQRRIVADQKRIVVASHKLCIDDAGTATDVTLLHSSGYREWDEQITKEMLETWRYWPYEVNGKRVPICTAYTQVFRNPQAPTRPRPSGPTA